MQECVEQLYKCVCVCVEHVCTPLSKRSGRGGETPLEETPAQSRQAPGPRPPPHTTACELPREQMDGPQEAPRRAGLQGLPADVRCGGSSVPAGGSNLNVTESLPFPVWPPGHLLGALHQPAL